MLNMIIYHLINLHPDQKSREFIQLQGREKSEGA